MTDWADGSESRNYGIKREINLCMLSDLWRVIIALVMIAGALLCYSWIQNQIVYTGYESQNLFAKEEALLRVQRKLVLEEATLRSPGRIERIARNDLGLVPLRPNRLMFPHRASAGISTSDSLAMAATEATNLKNAAQMGVAATIAGN